MLDHVRLNLATWFCIAASAILLGCGSDNQVQDLDEVKFGQSIVLTAAASVQRSQKTDSHDLQRSDFPVKFTFTKVRSKGDETEKIYIESERIKGVKSYAADPGKYRLTAIEAKLPRPGLYGGFRDYVGTWSIIDSPYEFTVSAKEAVYIGHLTMKRSHIRVDDHVGSAKSYFIENLSAKGITFVKRLMKEVD